MNKKDSILKILAEKYPDPRPALNFNSPFQLLIATMLSAQSTDKQVNKITNRLFADYPDLTCFLSLKQTELEEYIKSCGLYKNKAKNILASCKILQESYHGQVPASLDELIKLPGVGRKTANVVLAFAFGQNAIPVDTHVFRVANRLGLAQSDSVLGTEKDLEKNIPEKIWSLAHHWLIFHGREICKARKPECDICQLQKYCNWYQNCIEEKRGIIKKKRNNIVK